MNPKQCNCGFRGYHIRELHINNARIQGRKNVESGHLARIATKGARRRNELHGNPATLEGRLKSGRIAVESGHLASIAAKGARNQPREAKVRGGRIGGLIAAKSGQIASIGLVQGRKNVESGHLTRIARGVPATADGILFRSQTEASFYCVAQELGGEPAYEPQVIGLPDGRSYTPDFILGRSVLGIPANVPIELKPARNIDQKTLSKAIEAGAFVVYWNELVEESP